MAGRDPIGGAVNPRTLVAPMTTVTTSIARNSEFDSFLFAAVGDEQNGMALSVLSALARLDMDPWLEAASLRRLPTSAAASRLTRLLSMLPNRQPIPPGSATIEHLIGLLPKAVQDGAGSNSTPSRVDSFALWALLLYFAFAVTAMYVEQMGSPRSAQVPAGGGQAQIGGAANRAAAPASSE